MPVSSKHLNELLSNQERAKQTELFAKWPANRRYYRVKLVKFDQATKMTTVHFEDGASHDCPISELHLQFLETNPYEAVDDVICCVCDSQKTTKQNEIVICETCQQAYHQKCHDPKIPSSLLQAEHEDDDWTCATCEYMIEGYLKKEAKHELYASTPRDPKKPKKPEKSGKQIKLPPPPKIKVGKSEAIQPSEQVESSEDPKSQLIATEVVSAELQAKELAKRDDCESVDKHLSMLATELIERNAEAIQTPELVEAISAKEPAQLDKEVPKSIGASKSSLTSKNGAYKSVVRAPAKKTARPKKTETAMPNSRKNTPIAA